MLSKSRHFEYLLLSADPKADIFHLITASHSFFRARSHTTVCSNVDDNSTTAITESPELPSWIKFSETQMLNDPEDDDFVLPTISHWVENHQNPKLDSKYIVSDIIKSDVDKISSILVKNPFCYVDDVLKALNGSSISIDVLSESLVLQLLKRFSNDWVSAFGLFQWMKMQMGFNHSPESYNLMVDILGKTKKFDLMWELIEEMNELGSGYVTLVTMSKVMRRLAKSGRYEDAIEAFRKMERFGVVKDVAAVNALMDTLAKERSVEHAQNVFMEFKDGIPPNLHTFNILIHGWCKVSQMDKARKAMEEMENHGFCPDVMSYTCFVQAYCGDKDFRKVDDLLEEMQQKGCPPNAVTYTIVMHAFGKAKQINKAMEFYEKMMQNGCIPDSASYSSLIYILNSAGRLRDAWDIFEDMPNHGVAPDVLTYNTMISAACKHSIEEDALKLLQRMEESHCKPDLNTYHPLLKMCCKKKRIKVLSFLLSHMVKNDVSLDLATYSLLVHGLCKSDKLEHACSYFEGMVLRGFIPRYSTYKILTEQLASKGMEKAKKQIEELMLQARKQGEI